MCAYTWVYVFKLRYEWMYIGQEGSVWVCVYIVCGCMYTWVYVSELRYVLIYMGEEEVK